MQATIGNTLVVKRHTVSILAVMSPKDCVFCIGLYGESALAHFLLFIFMWWNVLAVQMFFLYKSAKQAH